MPERFDPYHKWLGIPPAEQPPNHYRLLAIRAFEDDADVIESAADQRMAHLRGFQSGENSELSQQLLNEVSQARVCLLDPQAKRAYDAQLRTAQAPPRKPAARKPSAAPAANSLQADSSPVLIDVEADSRRSKQKMNPAMLGAAGAASLILVVALAWGLMPGNEQRPEPESVVAQNPPDDATRERIDREPAAREQLDGNEPAANAPPNENAGTREDREPTPPPVVPAQPPSEPAVDPAARDPVTPSDQPAEEQPSPAVVEAPPPTKQKHPLPSDEQQESVRKQVNEVYDLAADRSPQQQSELAASLLALAADAADKPHEQYVLLRQTADLALAGGDAPLMLRAIDALDKDFEIDTQQTQQTMLIAFAKEARSDEALRSLIATYDAYVKAAIDEERLDDAVSIVNAVNTAAQRDRELRKAIYDRRREVLALHAAWKTKEDAIAALEANPDDDEANLAMGQWYCFKKNDWQQGLPHLAKGSDAELRALAQRELESPPTDADAQIGLADAWYDAAQKPRELGDDELLAHAGHWYAQALGKVTSAVVKLKVEKRLAEIGAVDVPTARREKPAVMPRGPITVNATLRRTLTGHTSVIRTVVYSPDGEQLISSSYDSTVRIWNAATGEVVRVLNTNRGRAFTAVVASDGKTIAASNIDGTIQLWKDTNAATQILNGHSAVAQYLAFSPNGRLLASASDDSNVKIWDVANGRELRTLTSHRGRLNFVDFSPDGERLLSSGWDAAEIKIWDVATWQELGTIKAGTRCRGFFSRGGRQALTFGQDKRIKFWDAQTGQLLRTLTGHTNTIHMVALSPDGRLMASGSHDKTILIWDLKTASPLVNIDAHDAAVYGLAFSKDGRTLASGSADATVKLWEIEVAPQ